MLPSRAATQAENTNVTLWKQVVKAGFDSRFLLKVLDRHVNMKAYQMKLHKCYSVVMRHWFGLQRECLVLDGVADMCCFVLAVLDLCWILNKVVHLLFYILLWLW